VRAIAGLYDMQHDAELRSVMTYPSPTSGEPVGPLVRQSDDQGGARGAQPDDAELARSTCGMMGRSPDFMNVTSPPGARPPNISAKSGRNSPATCGAMSNTSAKRRGR